MFPGFRQCHIMTYMGKPLIIEEPPSPEYAEENCPFPELRVSEVLFLDEWGLDGINMLCGIANAFEDRIEICGRCDDGEPDDGEEYIEHWSWMCHTRYYFHFCQDCLETSVAWSKEPPFCGWCGSRNTSPVAPATRVDFERQMIVNKWWNDHEGEEHAQYFYSNAELREAHLADCPPTPMTPEQREWVKKHCVPWEQIEKEFAEERELEEDLK